jgi:hypothetical protein
MEDLMPQVATPPFYLNWTFWAVVIATVALILSQLPPLCNLLRRAKLDLELFSRILINHKVGNPNVHLNLVLSNIGGKSIRIKAATIVLRREGKDIAILTTLGYLRNPNDATSNVLFTPFSLKPKDEWSYSVQFYRAISREDEKKFRIAQTDLRENILKKRAALESKDKDKVVEADPEFVTPLLDIVRAFFIWEPGEYEMKLSIDTVPERARVQKTFRFTLFESDSFELKKIPEDYKSGDGIYWDSRIKGAMVPIIEAK